MTDPLLSLLVLLSFPVLVLGLAHLAVWIEHRNDDPDWPV